MEEPPVLTDEQLEQQQPSSVLGEPDEDTANEAVQIFPPSAPALTLKEQLVHRERQRRIETERARWKRQFVLANTTPSVQENSDINGSNTERSELLDMVADISGHPGEELTSVVCSEDAEEQTLGGESTKGHPDEESNERLGFNMERFLRNSDSFNPQLEPMCEQDEDKPVLLERFLKDSVAAAANPVQEMPMPSEDVFDHEHGNRSESLMDVAQQRSVSFDVDGVSRTLGLNSIHDPINNMSMNVEAPSIDMSLNVDHTLSEASFDPHNTAPSTSQVETESANTDEPRVLRLTEADMLEMASIDEASIGNAPPSDREEVMSEIGELADMNNEAVSQDTPTTEMESNSQVSTSIRSASHVPPTASAIEALNIASQPTTADVVSAVSGSALSDVPSENAAAGLEPLIEANVARVSESLSTSNIAAESSVSPGLVNRQRMHLPFSHGESQSDVATPMVVGFDYDKDAPSSPVQNRGNDSYTELPLDVWSPQGIMHVSPLHPSGRPVLGLRTSNSSEALSESVAKFPAPPLANGSDNVGGLTGTLDESDNIPPEIITRKGDRASSTIQQEEVGIFFLERAFAQIQAEKTLAPVEEPAIVFQGQDMRPLLSLMIHFPTLLLLVFTIPYLFNEIGQPRFFVVMAFTPVCCSLSRLSMLRSSHHTREAISSGAVKPATFQKWCGNEIFRIAVLGMFSSFVLSGLAYLVSKFDARIAVVVFLSQMINMVGAATNGVISPIASELLPAQISKTQKFVDLGAAVQDFVGLVCWTVVSALLLRPGDPDGNTCLEQ